MRTSFTVSFSALAELLKIANEIEGDDNWTVGNWILDQIGVPPESDHDWNDLDPKEIEQGYDDDGHVLCCRDSFFHLFSGMEPGNWGDAKHTLSSWILAADKAEAEQGAPKT